MSETNTLTVSEFRKQLPRILHRVIAEKETFTITSHGLPYAVLKPITDPAENERIEQLVSDGLKTAVPASQVLKVRRKRRS